MEGYTMEDRSVETETNIDRYMVLVKTLDPELYAIKVALLDTKVNPDFLPEVIRSISNICYGTGYGNVKVSISNRKIAQIAATESDFTNKPALILGSE
jgi:hypothetical protein